MKIRITDLLDDYLDDDLPLDAMPEILPGDRPKPRPARKRHTPKKRLGQIVAAVLIVASVSVAGGIKLWGGGSAGKSLAAQPAGEAANPEIAAASPTAAPLTEPTAQMKAAEAPASAEETAIEDGGYVTTTISVADSGLNISAGDLKRNGSDFQVNVSLEANLENVTGFLLDDADVLLILEDGTTFAPTGAAESADPENPFVRQEVYSFDDGISEEQLASATLLLQIHSVLVNTTETSSLYTGSWDIGLSEAGVLVMTDESAETSATLSEGQDFTVTDLSVSATGCSFWLHTAADQFTLVPQGQLSLAVQQGGGETYYGFSLVTDGTLGMDAITIDSSDMSTRGVTDTQNLVYCTITWKETIAPTSITGLYFTNGTSGQTVDVSSYVY